MSQRSQRQVGSEEQGTEPEGTEGSFSPVVMEVWSSSASEEEEEERSTSSFVDEVVVQEKKCHNSNNNNNNKDSLCQEVTQGKGVAVFDQDRQETRSRN